MTKKPTQLQNVQLKTIFKYKTAMLEEGWEAIAILAKDSFKPKIRIKSSSKDMIDTDYK